MGEAVIEVTEEPPPRLRQVLRPVRRRGAEVRELRRSAASSNLRGINTRVITGGVVRTGDPILKLASYARRRRSFFAAAAETRSRTVAERLPTASTATASAR